MSISNQLIAWYRNNKRDLPWRHTTDAYLIWLSEIILQQTRVEQGMPYYLKFSESFPTVKTFAEASEDQILHLWQGLGYYSRGRNMLRTAKRVMDEFSGVFPVAFADLVQLPGIGEYTAAAISSFSNNEAKAVVDGNVYRVLARYFGIDTPINSTKGKKEFQAVADELLNIDNAGEHNQAIIEFGALHCTPRNPKCDTCPLKISCYAFKQQKVAELPVKLKNIKIRQRFFHFLIIKNEENEILIKRRSNDDIWGGLYDLPGLEVDERLEVATIFNHPEILKVFKSSPSIISISEEIKHLLTHQRIFARFIQFEALKGSVIENKDWIWVATSDLHQYGMPKLIFAFLKKSLN